MRRLLCCRTALKSAAGLLALLVLATPCSLARRSVCRAAAPTPPHAAPVVRVRPDSPIVTYVRWRFGVDRFTARRIVSDVRHYARRFRVSPMIVLAVIATESHFKPQAESDVGAEGLMQVYSGTRTYQIEHNIRDGVRILRQKLAFSGGSYPR
ncbi:MAG: transglycosylase SLT domain-containing protein, partial [Thermaerobacter sp.]|nr:transglycosylase SLT domain-containing protein [Thermaerobacter sp.]